jgi:hypothetical protein
MTIKIVTMRMMIANGDVDENDTCLFLTIFIGCRKVMYILALYSSKAAGKKAYAPERHHKSNYTSSKE